jgi:hypothetical protein
MYETLINSVLPYLDQNQPDLIKFTFMHQVQPWHPQSATCHEAAIAVALLEPTKFFAFSSALFAKQDQFFDINTFDKSRNQIVKELCELGASVGINRDALQAKLQYNNEGGFNNNGCYVVNELKYFIKMARFRHVHVSPTCIVDGLEATQISSSWQLDQWKDYFAKL